MPEIYFKVKSCKEFDIEIKTYPVIGLESETRNRRASSKILNRSQVKDLRSYQVILPAGENWKNSTEKIS